MKTSHFLDALVPSEADALVQQGDEESLKRAVELEPTRADAAVPLARLHLQRGETDEAQRILARVPGSFAAEGLTSRIKLEQAAASEDGPQLPGLADGFAALDAGDQERALDLLIGSLSDADGYKDDVRRVVVGILDELGVDNPLARDARRRLASALY